MIIMYTVECVYSERLNSLQSRIIFEKNVLSFLGIQVFNLVTVCCSSTIK